ncbi:CD225/dispanin family protein [Rubrobacter tropicus]|uniref:CD225/dispanin family protein n=1 Tax=Rubrobacter tropicus TaxID=2653851 RepID=UPI00140DD22B|nr:CD225/dispanin family protein [Rubrobacter tropicus]
MRCPNCNTWNGDPRRRRCSNCGTVLEPVPDYLARAVVAALICPVAGIVSLYFSVWTNRSLVAGDYFGAREHSRLARAWANAALWLVLAAALFFGLVTLLDAVGNP